MLGAAAFKGADMPAIVFSYDSSKTVGLLPFSHCHRNQAGNVAFSEDFISVCLVL